MKQEHPSMKPTTDAGRRGRKPRLLKWAGLAMAAVILLVAVGVAAFQARFRYYTAGEALADFRAGIAARQEPHPAVRFLELRYGPLDDPANRQKAFLHFFDPGHIEAMGLMVGRMKPGEKRTNIADAATWISNYRASMSPTERAALGQFLDSPAGRRQIQLARQEYLSRDVSYRSATAPVIAELMMTLDHARNR